MSRHLDVVFLDVGGPLYDEQPYYHSILNALREMGATVSDAEFAHEYDRCRQAQNGSFRRRLAHAFLGPDADISEVTARAARHWRYPAASLHPDAPDALDELSRRYRLGVIANQPASVRDAMRRDRIDRYFSVWGISEELGVEKPDPAIYTYAVQRAGAEPSRTAMAGDRLDYDIVPAKRAGMRTVWVLRGEAPIRPTAHQLSIPDASVRTLRELPAALEGIGFPAIGENA